jgi:putative thioredoxin
MASEFIIHVDESDFEYEVLHFSAHAPVVVDFWASWCIPCRVLGPKLEALAREGEGVFRLAKVDIDESPRLAKKYKIRSIPAVKAIVDGRVVAEFSGVLPEPRLREFITQLAPSPRDLMYEKGESLLYQEQFAEAEDAFREYLSGNPKQPEALFGLVRSLLFQGKGAESRMLLRNFPASHVYNTAQLLKPVARVFSDFKDEPVENDNPLEAAFRNGIRLARQGNIPAALDGFLDILRQQKDFRDGQVKDVFVGLLALLGDDHPDVRGYRRDLSLVLF